MEALQGSWCSQHVRKVVCDIFASWFASYEEERENIGGEKNRVVVSVFICTIVKKGAKIKVMQIKGFTSDPSRSNIKFDFYV